MKKVLSLILAFVMAMSIVGTIPAMAAEGKLIVYPTLPDVLPRNYDYDVEIAQNGETYAIPVYGTGRVDDSFSAARLTNRNFCEFAFEGEVTVRIRPRNDMSSYIITPSFRQIQSTYKDGWVEFKLTEPQNIVFRMNDDVNLDLAIFADAPETDVPDKNADDVMYFSAGLNNCEKYVATDTGVLTVPENVNHVYLEPGALVTARVVVEHSNVTISGHGAFIDPHTDRAGSEGMLHVKGSENNRLENVKLYDFKLLDSHAFNVTNRYTENLHIKNIKIMSNQISTDGISFFGGDKDCHLNPLIEDVYICCNDDNFVAGGVTNLVIKNVITNESHALLIVTQGTNNVTIDGATILRPNSIYKYWGEPYYGEKRYHDWPSVTLKNIYAEDMIGGNSTIATLRDLEGNLNVTYENCTFAGKDNGYQSYLWTYNISTLNMKFNNCFVAGQPLNNASVIEDYTWWNNTNTNTISFGSSFDKTAARVGYHKQMEKTVSHKGVARVTIGNYTYPHMAVVPFTENGVTYVDACVLEELGYNVRYNNGVFTAVGESGTITFNKNKKTGVIYGAKTKLPHTVKEVNGGCAISLETLKLLGFNGAVSSNGNVKIAPPESSGNLLLDADFDNHINPYIPNLTMSDTEWFYTNHFNPFKYGKYYLTSLKPYSGKYSLYVQANSGATDTGVAQYIYPDIQKYGAGVYRLEFYARLGKNLAAENKKMWFGIVKGNWEIGTPGNWVSHINDLNAEELTVDWKKYTYDIVITNPSDPEYEAAFLYIGPQGAANSTTQIDMCVDNLSLTYIDTVTSSSLADKLAQTPSAEGGVFRGWYKADGKALTKSAALSGSEKIYPRFANFGDCVDGYVNGDGAIEEKDTVLTDAKYTNGYYTQGAQLKVGNGAKTLRFVVAQSKTFKEYLKGEGFTGISYGVMVAYADNLNEMLTVNTKNAKDVKLTKPLLETEKYIKYGISVDTIDPTREVVIRPYVKYKDFSGVVRYIYGDASTASALGAIFGENNLRGAEVNRFGYSKMYEKYCTDIMVKM